MDQQNKQTISKFEIIGSSYINIIYNNIYNNAILSNSNIKNVYVASLLEYLNSSKEDEFFIQSVNCICAYFKSSTKFTDLSFKDCIELLIIEFVPSNYLNQLNKQQKSKILHGVLHNTLKRVISVVIKEYVDIIIDNHQDYNNLVKLQDIYLKNLWYEKNILLSQFADPSQKSEDVDKLKIYDLLEKFKQEVSNLKGKNDKLLVELKESSNNYNKLKSDYALCLENNKNTQTKLYESLKEIEKLNSHIKRITKNKSIPQPTQIIVEEEEEEEEVVIVDEDEQLEEDEHLEDDHEEYGETNTYEDNIFESIDEEDIDMNKILKKNNSLLDTISFDKSVIINKNDDDCLKINEHLDKLKTNKINETLLFN